MNKKELPEIKLIAKSNYDHEKIKKEGWVDLDKIHGDSGHLGFLPFLTGYSEPFEDLIDTLKKILDLCDSKPDQEPNVISTVDICGRNRAEKEKAYNEFYQPFDMEKLFAHFEGEFSAVEEDGIVKADIFVGTRSFSLHGFVTKENIKYVISDLEKELDRK